MMNFMNGIVRAPALLLCLAIVPWSAACTDRDLSRAKAAGLINKEYAQLLGPTCANNTLLAKKTEFAPIAQNPICDAEFAVTGVRKVSETETVVLAKLVRRSRSAAIRKWLEAFDSLERRLTSLRGKKYFSWPHLGDIWEFTDTSDGQKFIGLAGSGQPENIRNTTEWKELHSLKQEVSTLAEKGQLEEDHTIEQPFHLYDDGWRVVKKR